MRVLVVTAIYPKLDRPEFGSFVRTQVESLARTGLAVETLVLDGRNRKLIYAKGIVQLRSRLATRPFDLVHAHYSYAGVVARTQWRVPVVVTYHGDDVLGTVGADGRTTRLSRVITAGGRVLGQLVDSVIVQSDQMAQRFRRDVHVIPHEVDLATFQPTDREDARAELGLDPHRKYVLFASPPDIPVKNFPLARAAVELVRERHRDVELVVVHREPQPRLALYMSACDVLAFPSWQEGSPNIVKQAMACNLPIVATDVGDVRSVIGATAGCHLAPPVPDALARLLGEELALRRRTDGRRAVAHLAGDRVATRVIDVYEEVLRNRQRGRRLPAHPTPA